MKMLLMSLIPVGIYRLMSFFYFENNSSEDIQEFLLHINLEELLGHKTHTVSFVLQRSPESIH